MHDDSILHISPGSFGSDGIWGGGERYPLELSLAMSKRIPTRLLTFGSSNSRWKNDNLEIITLRTRWHLKGNALNPISERFVSECVRAERIHTHHYETILTTAAVSLSRVTGQTVFCTDHGGKAPNLGRQLRVGDKLTRFLPVSEFSASIFPDLQKKVTVIYGGVDVSRYYPVLGDRHKTVVFVGRVLPHKGIDILIRAVPTKVPLHIYGRTYDGVYLEELMRLAQGRDVTFHNNASDSEIIDAYRGAWMAVLPSVYQTYTGTKAPRSELLGLALIEAMACGTPVIASSVGGMPEVVAHGHAGLVVQPGSVEELAEAINSLLNNGPIWRELSAAGLSQVREKFNWECVVDKCLNAYEGK
jgi:glycosyltransferase involved in cell wall biosynthesis